MPAQTVQERCGLHEWRGQPVTLLGDGIKAGDRAPDFNLRTSEFKPFHVQDALGNGTRAALFVAVPSIDTGLCSREIQTFNERSGDLPADRIALYGVSMDLPYAQKRWAESLGINRIALLSDYYDHSFGYAYGIRVKERGLLARSIFIVNRNGVVTHATIVPEATHEPDYDAVIAAARSVIV